MFMFFLMCGCSTHTSPKTIISIKTIEVIKKNNRELYPDITGVKCDVFIGDQKYVIITPSNLDVFPKKDDELKILCTKDGYRSQGKGESYAKAISFFDKINRMNEIGLGRNIGLGLAFLGIPVALGLKSFYPIIAIPVLSYTLYYMAIIENSPYPEGYTFHSTSFGIYMERAD